MVPWLEYKDSLVKTYYNFLSHGLTESWNWKNQRTYDFRHGWIQVLRKHPQDRLSLNLSALILLCWLHSHKDITLMVVRWPLQLPPIFLWIIVQWEIGWVSFLTFPVKVSVCFWLNHTSIPTTEATGTGHATWLGPLGAVRVGDGKKKVDNAIQNHSDDVKSKISIVQSVKAWS